MPIYEYKCYNCNHEFEVTQKITADPIKVCPECGEEEVKRIISSTSFHLKGDGWYKTDYKGVKKKENKSEPKESKGTKKETIEGN